MEPHFLSRAECLLGNKPLIYWHFYTDLSIAGAYYLIPVLLLWFTQKAGRYAITSLTIPRRLYHIAVAFSAFIFFCGSGHLIDALSVQHSMPYLKGLCNAGTLIASIFTAVLTHLNFYRILKVLDSMSLRKGPETVL